MPGRNWDWDRFWRMIARKKIGQGKGVPEWKSQDRKLWEWNLLLT